MDEFGLSGFEVFYFEASLGENKGKRLTRLSIKRNNRRRRVEVALCLS
jgi:hypothetical protein